jgi:hypothetical protein
VDVPCAARLPLVAIPAVSNAVESLSNDVEEALKAKIKLGRNNVRVVLNVIRCDILTLLISTSLPLTIARKITMKIILLIISAALRIKECSSSTKTPNLRY